MADISIIGTGTWGIALSILLNQKRSSGLRLVGFAGGNYIPAGTWDSQKSARCVDSRRNSVGGYRLPR